MIKDKEKLTTLMSSWLLWQVKSARAKGFLVNLTGDLDSSVTASVCRAASDLAKKEKVDIEVHGLICEDILSETQKTQVAELVDKFNIQTHTIKLSDMFESFQTQNLVDTEVLKSTLSSVTLDLVAKKIDAVIIGSITKSTGEVLRSYYKRGEGSCDGMVLGCLYKSEVFELAEHMEVPSSIIHSESLSDMAHEGLDLSFEELEMIMRFVSGFDDRGFVDEMSITRVVNNLKKAPEYVDETFLQRLLGLAKLEAQSRHKANPNCPNTDKFRDPNYGVLI